MKLIATLITVALVCSCSIQPKHTGQAYVENSPTFYLSIAPSFTRPCEFEVMDDELIYSEYSGLGGFDWGNRKTISRSRISREQQEEIRSLTLHAISDKIKIEKDRKDRGQMIVVADGTNWYILSDNNEAFISISTNNPESKIFFELRDVLNLILGQHNDCLYLGSTRSESH